MQKRVNGSVFVENSLSYVLVYEVSKRYESLWDIYRFEKNSSVFGCVELLNMFLCMKSKFIALRIVCYIVVLFSPRDKRFGGDEMPFREGEKQPHESKPFCV